MLCAISTAITTGSSLPLQVCIAQKTPKSTDSNKLTITQYPWSHMTQLNNDAQSPPSSTVDFFMKPIVLGWNPVIINLEYI